LIYQRELAMAKSATKVFEDLAKDLTRLIGDITDSAVKRQVGVAKEELQALLSLAGFLEALFSPPRSVPAGEKTAFREDAALRDVCQWLAHYPSQKICVLDVGCGIGNVPVTMLHGLAPAMLAKITYVGIDKDPKIVDGLIEAHKNHSPLAKSDDGQERKLGDFFSFDVHLVDVANLSQTILGKFDLVMCHNLVHEIPPFAIPKLLSDLNSLLKSETLAEIVVIDMEVLPRDEPESDAFTWGCREFERLLRAAGYKNASATKHDKSVPVFSSVVTKAENVDVGNACLEVRRVLEQRQKLLIRSYESLRRQERKDFVMMCDIILVLAQIAYVARCLEQEDH